MADAVILEKELEERIIEINRCAKVVKGGRRFSFSALVAVGDGVGHVGVGFGKANEVPMAIQKALNNAKKDMFPVPIHNTTVTHEVMGHAGAGLVFIKPAAPGTGVIAGGPVRAVLELAGVKNILTKSIGSSNALNMVRATVDGLKKLKNIKEEAVPTEKEDAEA